MPMPSNLVEKLSSQCGDKTQAANVAVADICVAEPDLLVELVPALAHKNVKMAGDAAEVFTMVAQKTPKAILPYATALLSQLQNKATRVRWEVTHALALIADEIPREIEQNYARLEKILENDASVIVRDYTTDMIGRYAKAGKTEAQKAFSTLRDMLQIWGERHATRVLEGLMHVANSLPEAGTEIQAIAQTYAESMKPTIKKTAKKLLKQTG
jgi:hypothetical protein